MSPRKNSGNIPEFSELFAALVGMGPEPEFDPAPTPARRPRIEVRQDDGGLQLVGFRTEADVRRLLARIAYAYGWDVEEEVVVPGWGRIDLVLNDPDLPNVPILIELKLALKRPSEVRRGFQQADGYGRWWKVTYDQGAELVLAGCWIDDDVAQPISDAYPEVRLEPVSRVMGLLAVWRPNAVKRWAQARERLNDLERELDINRAVVADIERRGEKKKS